MEKDFALKRYKITKPFGSYRVGDIVAFHGMHAKQFAANIEELKEKADKKSAEKVSEKAAKKADK